jgi:hypothetical protein
MSMAFEAADLAREPLATYSRTQCSWQTARVRIAGNCDRIFRGRLAWGKWLHGLMVLPVLRHYRADCILGSKWVFDTFFARTR